MRKKSKMVAGVGINDSLTPVVTCSVIDGVKKTVWSCPMYAVWADMLVRCYSKDYQNKRPTYIGCTVDPAWLSFSAFRDWMKAQPWEGNRLDKDILIPGNKVYGPDSCVFVTCQLNSFLVDHGSARGDFPIGVTLHRESGKFRSRCSNPFTKARENLGLFDCPESAYEAWRIKKNQHACAYADMQNDQRIAQALRSRFAS